MAVAILAGEIVEMSPETPIHYNTAKRGAKYLEELLVGKADVRFNGPITLPDSEPSGGDNPLKRLAELAFHPVESSKNSSLLTGLLRMNF